MRKMFSCYGWMNFSTDTIDAGGILEGRYLIEQPEIRNKIRRVHTDMRSIGEVFTTFADEWLSRWMAELPGMKHVDVMIHLHHMDSIRRWKVEEFPVHWEKTVQQIMQKMGDKPWEPPGFSILLCPSTLASLASGSYVECGNIHCEVFP